jgi:hypothetical protein
MPNFILSLFLIPLNEISAHLSNKFSPLEKALINMMDDLSVYHIEATYYAYCMKRNLVICM